MKWWLLGAGLGVAVTAGLGAWWVNAELETPFYGAAAPETFVDIPRGESSTGIAESLVREGVLRYSLPFLLYLRWTGDGSRLQAGEYRFDRKESPVAIIRRLKAGDVFLVSVVVPEGLTAKETLQLLAAANLREYAAMEPLLRRVEWIRDLDPQADDLEGYLFPDTYRFPRRVQAETILKTMVDRFRTVYRRLLARSPSGGSLDPRSVVTVASLIEKETAVDAERFLIASVLRNRLERRIPLACDPTIIYALKLAGRYDGNIRKADLQMPSPYNTYLNPGLPPGPIANPGEKSLAAALDPPRTNYLYFVSRNDGSHQFSEDFRSHERAVARFQKRRDTKLH